MVLIPWVIDKMVIKDWVGELRRVFHMEYFTQMLHRLFHTDVTQKNPTKHLLNNV